MAKSDASAVAVRPELPEGIDAARPDRLDRWLDRLVDREGVPRRLAVAEWPSLLERLDAAWRLRVRALAG